MPDLCTNAVLSCVIRSKVQVDWRKETAQRFLAEMDVMGVVDGLKFMEDQGSELAKDIRREIRDSRTKSEVGVALERAIGVAQKQNKTNEGRRTWQTLLTAAAFPRRANDGAEEEDEEEEDEEEEPQSISGKRKAAALGVSEKAWRYALKRMKALEADIYPAEAIENGVYWSSPRARRSDAVSDELVSLMRQFWHTDEVSRATGNSADRDMWKPSKSPTAVGHPRRQLYEAGGGDAVYAKFLKWADYRSFNSQQGEDFADPGRTLFLSTRCKCLIPPVMEQCACKIHSQQMLYIEALANVRTPRIHMFTDGCGKQYKGRQNFRFLANSVRHIGFFVDHHFAATSHFKGCHDGIGSVAKNAMRRRERYGHRIMGADGVVNFLKGFFREMGGEGEDGMRKYFARWSPYRIRKVHVELIGKDEIYRPGSVLEGIEGTRDMYHFAGTNAPKNDVETAIDLDVVLVLKRERGEALSPAEEERLTQLGEVKVVKVTGRWDGVQAEGAVAGNEKVTAKKVKRRHAVRTRSAACFCSSCQVLNYEECHVHKTYPLLVPAVMDGEVKETVVMVTGVAPVGVDEAQEIKFKPRASSCSVSRVTGTQWQKDDQSAAEELWEAFGLEEELLPGF